MGVRRGSWGFGEEGKVLAVGEPANATDRRDLNVKQDWSVKDSRGKEEWEKAEMETETEKEGKATGVLKWFGKKKVGG